MRKKWFRDERGEVFWLTPDGGAAYVHKYVRRATTRRWVATDAEVRRAKRTQRRAWETALENRGLSFFVLKRQRVPHHLWDELHQGTGMLCLLRCAFHYRSDEGTFSTYAVRALHKEYARAWRKRKRYLERERLDGLYPEKGRTVEDDSYNQEVRDQVQLIMGRLPEFQRVLLTLRFWKGLKYAAIGRMIGCSRTVAMYKVKNAIEAAKGVLCQADR